MTAPIMSTELEVVRGLPPGFVLNCQRLGCTTIDALADWIGEPDENGRVGLSKLRSMPHIGAARIDRVDQAMVALGVDLSR